MSSQYFIPDLLISWPWQRILNPALAEVKDDSNAWVKSLALFEQAQLRKFNACDFSMWYFTWFVRYICWSTFLRSSGGSSCAPTRQRLAHICLKSFVYDILIHVKFRTSPNHLRFDEFLLRFRRIHGRCKQNRSQQDLKWCNGCPQT